MTTDSGNPWAEFWGGDHAIYVSARHARVHYERIAEDLAGLLAERQAPAMLLDWGCGDALGAPAVAAHCRELLLYDAVPAVQARLQRRFAGAGAPPNLRVLDGAAWRGLAAGSVDLILLNSVAQYLTRGELAALLDDFRRVLAPGGELWLADIIPPDAGVLGDVAMLLGTGARHGFLLAAFGGLARTFFSSYRQVRKRAGFATYTEAQMRELLHGHGFSAERLARNIGFSRQRMTFRAKVA